VRVKIFPKIGSITGELFLSFAKKLPDLYKNE
jgi:hypothetical protein